MSKRMRSVLALALAGVLASGVAVAARAARGELRSDFKPPQGAVKRPIDPELAAAADVNFSTTEATLHGWWLAPHNGAVVIFLHGTGASRAQLLPEIRAVTRHGYGALAFDWPGHGESSGTVSWGKTEQAALESAIDYVGRVAPGANIDLFAFSMGTMIASQIGAADSRVKAMILAGSFADPFSSVGYQFRYWGALSAWPAAWMARAEGTCSDGRTPGHVIRQFAPRPLLLIAGSDDDVVPVSQSRELFDAAKDPKELWIVDGAHHGDYESVAGREYERHLVEFLDRALLSATNRP